MPHRSETMRLPIVLSNAEIDEVRPPHGTSAVTLVSATGHTYEDLQRLLTLIRKPTFA